MPCRPSSPICGHSSRGNQSFSSISAASGAILSAAKRCVVSRIVSAISPRSKSRPGMSVIEGLLFGVRLAERERLGQGASPSLCAAHNIPVRPELVEGRPRDRRASALRLRSGRTNFGARQSHDRHRRPDRHPLLRPHADGRLPGRLSGASATELGAAAVKAAVERAGVDGDAVEKIYMGCVLPAGLGQAPARQAALGAGFPARSRRPRSTRCAARACRRRSWPPTRSPPAAPT